jgi:hypothetical protein
MGALENVRAEAAGAEGTERLQDGHHIMMMKEHDPNTGSVSDYYAISHNVEGGKTVGGGGPFLPSIQTAHHDPVIKGR